MGRGVYAIVGRATPTHCTRVEIIKDCGHVPQVERLEILKPLVANFLAA